MYKYLAIFTLLFSVACSGESTVKDPSGSTDGNTTASDTGFGSGDAGATTETGTDDDTGTTGDTSTDDAGTDTSTDDAGTDTSTDDAGTDTSTDDAGTDTSTDDTGCIATTCATENAECGVIDDGCEDTINCGNCNAPNTCGGAGEDNKCGCTPSCEGKICGKKDDCNGTCEAGSGCCEDECSPIGTVQCGGDGDSVISCVNQDNDPCLEWTKPQSCGGAGCKDGECEICTPSCTGKVCGDSDGCGKTCGAGSGCCKDECSPQGTIQCGGDGDSVISCVNEDNDPCLEWTKPQSCGGEGCKNGECVSCTDQCKAGTTKCSSSSKLATCGNNDSDPCLEWSIGKTCETGKCEKNECTEPVVANCIDPVKIIGGIGGSNSGVCDGDNMLTNDGKAAEFWSNSDKGTDLLIIPETACQVIDFGKLCSPKEICVEAWAGQNGCSGDGCNGACEKCKAWNMALDVFAHEKNSTLNYKYQFSAYGNQTSNPGQTTCYKASGDLQFVMVCRPLCTTTDNANSFNMYVDHVWLKN